MPAQLLVVHGDALASQQDVKPSIAEPTMHRGQIAPTGAYRGTIGRMPG
jgi:hypothetical protein